MLPRLKNAIRKWFSMLYVFIFIETTIQLIYSLAFFKCMHHAVFRKFRAIFWGFLFPTQQEVASNVMATNMLTLGKQDRKCNVYQNTNILFTPSNGKWVHQFKVRSFVKVYYHMLIDTSFSFVIVHCTNIPNFDIW